jgi:anti-sigma factor RsiW
LDAFDCESIARRLWPFLDSTLPDGDRAIIVEHLAGCTECRSHYDFARALLGAVHELQPAVANEALRARVLAAVIEDGYSEVREEATVGVVSRECGEPRARGLPAMKSRPL